MNLAVVVVVVVVVVFYFYPKQHETTTAFDNSGQKKDTTAKRYTLSHASDIIHCVADLNTAAWPSHLQLSLRDVKTHMKKEEEKKKHKPIYSEPQIQLNSKFCRNLGHVVTLTWEAIRYYTLPKGDLGAATAKR